MRKCYWFFGHRLTILAGPADTEGHYDFVEGWDPPGTQVPLHLHRRYSEQIYVLEGGTHRLGRRDARWCCVRATTLSSPPGRSTPGP